MREMLLAGTLMVALVAIAVGQSPSPSPTPAPDVTCRCVRREMPAWVEWHGSHWLYSCALAVPKDGLKHAAPCTMGGAPAGFTLQGAP